MQADFFHFAHKIAKAAADGDLAWVAPLPI